MVSKLNKNSLYFRQAAHALGDADATRRLLRVISGSGHMLDCNWVGDDPNKDLDECFKWFRTREGKDFWSRVYNRARADGIK